MCLIPGKGGHPPRFLYMTPSVSKAASITTKPRSSHFHRKQRQNRHPAERDPLDAAVKAEAQRDKMALLLQSQPGVGAITAMAYVLTMGDVARFPRGKQVASYLG